MDGDFHGDFMGFHGFDGDVLIAILWFSVVISWFLSGDLQLFIIYVDGDFMGFQGIWIDFGGDFNGT